MVTNSDTADVVAPGVPAGLTGIVGAGTPAHRVGTRAPMVGTAPATGDRKRRGAFAPLAYAALAHSTARRLISPRIARPQCRHLEVECPEDEAIRKEACGVGRIAYDCVVVDVSSHSQQSGSCHERRASPCRCGGTRRRPRR